MKKSFQLKSLLVSVIATGAVVMSVAPVAVQAGASANVGMVFNYVFRGVEQAESSSAFAGIDLEADSGFM